MKLLTYIIPAIIGILLSLYGLVFVAVGGINKSFLIIAGVILAAHIGTYIFVGIKAKKGEGSKYSFLMALPIIMLCGLFYIFQIGNLIYSNFSGPPAAFVAECKSAGEQFFKLPASPVQSIAYKGIVSDFESYQVSNKGRIGMMMNGNKIYPKFDKAIKFTQRVYDTSKGFLHTNSAIPFAIDTDTPSADVLISYEIIHPEELNKALVNQGTVGFVLTMTDTRDNQKLAMLKYFISHKDNRLCGPIKNNVFSEKAFIVTALGLE